VQDTPRVVTIGHAIVDVLASCDDALLEQLGLDKATMGLVDVERAAEIRSRVEVTKMASGGSAANTAVGLAALGVPTSFVGRVADDEMGAFFAGDLNAAGVSFAGGSGRSSRAGDVADGDPAGGGAGSPGTGISIVMVTPDAERTMCTSLGVGGELGSSQVDPAEIARAEVVYIEGYLCGKVVTDTAVAAAMQAAASSSTLVALSASDPFWVSLHRDGIRALLGSVQVLFANEEEALVLSGRADVPSAVRELSAVCPTVVVTLGAQGCVVAEGGETLRVEAPRVDRVVDTTGAGDSFAAGYLYGIVNQLGARRSAQIGSLIASKVITRFGARPEVSDLVGIN
jgi:sugar/nucleoside kinase (ribokinase family)